MLYIMFAGAYVKKVSFFAGCFQASMTLRFIS